MQFDWQFAPEKDGTRTREMNTLFGLKGILPCLLNILKQYVSRRNLFTTVYSFRASLIKRVHCQAMVQTILNRGTKTEEEVDNWRTNMFKEQDILHESKCFKDSHFENASSSRYGKIMAVNIV